MKKGIEIGVLGLGHLGLVYSACLSDLGYRVCGFELNKKLISALTDARFPFFEPELDALVKNHLGRNLLFTNNLYRAVKNKKYIFIAVERGFKKTESLLKKVSRISSPGTTFVVSAPLPVGSTRKLMKLFKNKTNFIYLPENLKFGEALKRFFDSKTLALGSDSSRLAAKFKADFPVFKSSILMSLESAEMAKLALNAYLAVNISFASEVSVLCEKLGADYTQVVKALKLDSRVNPNAPIDPYYGFWGGHLKRDLKALENLAKEKKLRLKLTSAARSINTQIPQQIAESIEKTLKNLKGKKIGLLGLTYKTNTDSTNDSLSLKIASLLSKKGAQIRALDPKCKYLKASQFIEIWPQNNQFFEDLDILILFTPHPEFKKISPSKTGPIMKQKFVLDTKNFLDKKAFIEAGFYFI